MIDWVFLKSIDVFEILETTTDPGMAGNVVKNLKQFGALVEFASNSEEFSKIRYVDSDTKETVFRVDTIENFTPIQFSDDAFEMFKIFDAIIVSDYNRGLVTEETIQKAFTRKLKTSTMRCWFSVITEFLSDTFAKATLQKVIVK